MFQNYVTKYYHKIDIGVTKTRLISMCSIKHILGALLVETLMVLFTWTWTRGWLHANTWVREICASCKHAPQHTFQTTLERHCTLHFNQMYCDHDASTCTDHIQPTDNLDNTTTLRPSNIYTGAANSEHNTNLSTNLFLR